MSEARARGIVWHGWRRPTVYLWKASNMRARGCEARPWWCNAFVLCVPPLVANFRGYHQRVTLHLWALYDQDVRMYAPTEHSRLERASLSGVP